jgi:CRISPR-associated protein Cas1
VGFLHEFVGYQTKQSLVYDLQEPFRWLADVAVMDAFESQVLTLPDFYFTGDDYRYRFDPEAKGRFLGLLRERFNSGARYNGHACKWDTVIEQKAAELGRYLLGQTDRVDFSEPTSRLATVDSWELRKLILSLSQSKARRLGIGKSTLHYLRKKAKGDRSFSIYKSVHEKLKSGKNGLTTPS